MIKTLYMCVKCGKYESDTLNLIEVKTGEMASFYIHQNCYNAKGLNSREVKE